MKKLFVGLVFLSVFFLPFHTRAEETIFVPTPKMTPGQTFLFEFRPASPDIQVVGVIVIIKHVSPQKEERVPQKDTPVIPLRKLEQTAFWEKPSGKLGPFKLTIGQPAPKDMFGSPPLLAVLSRKF